MDEAEWLACEDPEVMLKRLGPDASERKLRLFMVACCRRIWPLIKEPHCCDAVVVAERFVEGEADADELAAACEEANLHWPDSEAEGSMDARAAATAPSDPEPYASALDCVAAAASAVECEDDTSPEAGRAEGAAQAALLRCIFCFPDRAPERIGPALFAWSDGIIRKLAEAIYDEKAFDRLPILADALEDAGCADAAILSHLRSPGPHARGCWALDGVLGRG